MSFKSRGSLHESIVILAGLGTCILFLRLIWLFYYWFSVYLIHVFDTDNGLTWIQDDVFPLSFYTIINKRPFMCNIRLQEFRGASVVFYPDIWGMQHERSSQT